MAFCRRALLGSDYHRRVVAREQILTRYGLEDEFLDAGFREEFNADNICIVEWPEKAEGVLPKPDLAIFLNVNGDGRDVELQAFSDLGQLCLDRLHFAPHLG